MASYMFPQRGLDAYPDRPVTRVVSVAMPSRNLTLSRGQRPLPCLVTFELKCTHHVTVAVVGIRWEDKAREAAECVTSLRCLVCGPA
jgi:hypothetical protein